MVSILPAAPQTQASSGTLDPLMGLLGLAADPTTGGTADDLGAQFAALLAQAKLTAGSQALTGSALALDNAQHKPLLQLPTTQKVAEENLLASDAPSLLPTLAKQALPTSSLNTVPSWMPTAVLDVPQAETAEGEIGNVEVLASEQVILPTPADQGATVALMQNTKIEKATEETQLEVREDEVDVSTSMAPLASAMATSVMVASAAMPATAATPLAVSTAAAPAIAKVAAPAPSPLALNDTPVETLDTEATPAAGAPRDAFAALVATPPPSSTEKHANTTPPPAQPSRLSTLSPAPASPASVDGSSAGSVKSTDGMSVVPQEPSVAESVNTPKEAVSVESTSLTSSSAPTPDAPDVQALRAPQQAAATLTPPPVAEQIQVHIRQALENGQDQIRVNLRPEELGSIEIRMERGDDGIMRVHVLAERQATLELLKNSASDLNSGLQQSGLKTDAGSMQFNLRDQGQFAGFGQSSDNRGNSQGGTLLAQANQELLYKASNDDSSTTGAARSIYASGLDIRI